MKLSDLIHKESILTELKAKDKKGVLEELVDLFLKQEPSFNKDSLVKILMERERLGSTGIGDGVAIPHGKFHTLRHPVISFGRSKQGVDFDSMDGEPTYLFFLLVAPENSTSIHLKALAKIAKMLKNSSFRKELMDLPGKKEIYQAIIRNDEEF